MRISAHKESHYIVQVRVVLALILRETRVTFGTAQLGYLWAVVNPAAIVMVLVAIFSTLNTHPPLGTSFVLFFATGILPFDLNRKLSSALMNVFKANQGLMAYPLVKELDVVAARFLLILSTYLLIIFVFFGMLILLDIIAMPREPEQILLAIATTSAIGLGGGLINAVIFGIWPTWQQIDGILTRPLFFLSGIFFLPSFFSPQAQDFLSWNPLIHITEWIREGYYGFYQSPILDKGYVVTWAGVLMLVGFSAERLYRKKIN